MCIIHVTNINNIQPGIAISIDIINPSKNCPHVELQYLLIAYGFLYIVNKPIPIENTIKTIVIKMIFIIIIYRSSLLFQIRIEKSSKKKQETQKAKPPP